MRTTTLCGVALTIFSARTIAADEPNNMKPIEPTHEQLAAAITAYEKHGATYQAKKVDLLS